MNHTSIPSELGDAIADADLPADAIASNRRLGTDLAATTNLTQINQMSLQAKVAGPSTRTVTITVDNGVLDWRCTCSRKLTKPCKHVVAVAQYVKRDRFSGS